ncbi:hypothetical protein [Bifidobacterium simiarum]|uniref:hypothetical protein n=1 Tax=Bifidobacterium simiarum TaxID=2045441 RepID=UPI001BDDC002|nr:hypothetical protein [Bifidobacterium simiarum]MBT1165614.1 hypothetical protein [Bifidobacterium simiarum]
MTTIDMNSLFDNAFSDADQGVDDHADTLAAMLKVAAKSFQGCPKDGNEDSPVDESSDATSDDSCADELHDLFSKAFLEDDDTAQVAAVMADLKESDARPAPDAAKNAQYADTIDWLRGDVTFAEERSLAAETMSMMIRMQAESLLNAKLDYWSYILVKFARSRGFLLDEHLARVWLCSKMTGVVRDMLEEQAGIALGVGHTLTNIARAGGTSQPNVRTKWPHIRDYADAYRAMKTDGGAHTAVIGNRFVSFSPADDKEYLDRARRIVEERGKTHEIPVGRTAEGASGEQVNGDDSANDIMPVDELSAAQRMNLGLGVAFDLTDVVSKVGLDVKEVHDMLSQGDCLWAGVGEARGKSAANDAMRAAVKEVFDEAGMNVQNVLASITAATDLDIDAVSQSTLDIAKIWKKGQVAWGLAVDDDMPAGAVRVVLLASGKSE